MNQYKLRKDVDELQFLVNRLKLCCVSSYTKEETDDKIEEVTETFDYELEQFVDTLINEYGNVYEYYYHPTLLDDPVVCLNEGGLFALGGEFYNFVRDSWWGIGYLANGFNNTDKWKLQFRAWAYNNRDQPASVFVLPEESGDLRDNSIELRTEYHPPVPAEPWHQETTVYTNVDGVSTEQGNFKGKWFLTKFSCPWFPIKIVKEDETFTVYLDNEEPVTFTFDGFNEVDELTTGFTRAETHDDYYHGGTNHIKDIVCVMESKEKPPNYVLTVPTQTITTDNAITIIEAYVTLDDEPVEGVVVYAQNESNYSDYGAEITNNEGKVYIIVETKTPNNTKTYAVKTLNNSIPVTIITSVVNYFYDPCTPSTHLTDGTYSYNSFTGNLQQVTNGIRFETNRADRWLEYGVLCPVRDYEFIYTYTTPNSDGPWNFVLSNDDSRYVQFSTRDDLIQMRIANGLQEFVLSDYNLVDGVTIKVTKIGTSWSLYIDDTLVTTQTYDLAASTPREWSVRHAAGSRRNNKASDNYTIFKNITIREIIPTE